MFAPLYTMSMIVLFTRTQRGWVHIIDMNGEVHILGLTLSRGKENCSITVRLLPRNNNAAAMEEEAMPPHCP